MAAETEAYGGPFALGWWFTRRTFVTSPRVLERSGRIRARIGYEDGQQVSDSRAPEWQAHVKRQVDLRQRMVDVRKGEGRDTLTITPELGPPNDTHRAVH